MWTERNPEVFAEDEFEDHSCRCFMSPPCSHCVDCKLCSPICSYCIEEHAPPYDNECPMRIADRVMWRIWYGTGS